MALGMDKKPAAATVADAAQLDSVISTLQRCLQMASTSCSPLPAMPLKERKESCSDDRMPDGSQWPHCQHTISQDDPKGNDGQNIKLVQYQDETQIGAVMRLMTKDLSEPYSIYTYRFFVHNWPELCILAIDTTSDTCVGAVVGKLEQQPDGRHRGYIAMLAVDESCRRMGLATRLVRRAIENMQKQNCDEVYLETEVDNNTAQGLYTKLGFIRDKRLIRYYLNGNDAFRLKLYFTSPSAAPAPEYC